jgi:hypothetical protein
MSTSFDNKKELRFVITLGTGTFGSSNNNQVTLEGFRATVEIDKAGGVQFNRLHAQIYGLSQSLMNQLTLLQFQYQQMLTKNQLQVFAVDGLQVSLIFSGNMITAWGNYSNVPDVFLEIQAVAGFVNQLTPVAPTSYNGPVPVATVMSSLAAQMGYAFENNGVSAMLTNPYLPNTALEQAKSAAQAAGIDMYLDDETLAICPRNQPRTGYPIPQISAQSGLVGYPTFGSATSGPSIRFKCLFNPAIKFGGQVQLVTSIQAQISKAATGAAPALQLTNNTWIVNSISHSLQSETPGGRWFSEVGASTQRLVASS